VGIGLVEALGAVRRAPRVLWRIRRLLDRWRPDLVWTVDNPGLNLRIGAMARRRGIPVVHLGSPQVWAWRPGRVRRVAESADVLLCLLPFEPAWYVGTGVRAVFVGHPAARLHDEAPGEGLVVGLAPGSRESEVAALWPVFQAVAERIRRRRPEVRFQVAVAPTIGSLPGSTGTLQCKGVAEAARGAHVFLTSAGTATVELAARGIPMVVAYRVHPVTWALGRPLLRIRHVALPNLLAGRELVPEHLQDLDPDAIADDVLRMAGSGVGGALREVAATLEGDRAAGRIAQEVSAMLHRRGSQQVTWPKAASH
jgi:lipid-A-disaccharide synthase